MSISKQALVPFAEGVWIGTEPVVHLGLQLTATMALIRLADASLLVYSPVALTTQRRASVEALGTVAHVYAPNLFHHRWAGEWVAAFPTARLHAPAGLAKKRPDLRIDRAIGSAPEEAFSGTVEEFVIGGLRLEEAVLHVQPARCLLVADLVHNIGRPQHGWTGVYTRAMGFYDRVALSRMLRWTAFSDRRAARRSIDELLRRPFERIVLGHGTPLTENARESLAAAYRWLPQDR